MPSPRLLAVSCPDRNRRSVMVVSLSVAAIVLTGMFLTGRLIPAGTAQSSPMNGAGGTVLVATCDSSEKAKQQADFVGDCSADEQEINAAIESLPVRGGIVQLAEGTYDIRAVDGTLGGVLIERSNVVLQGRGTSTKLILADHQDTNVIRIIGNGLSNITVRDLSINGNRDNNEILTFEGNGIKAASDGADPMKAITVDNVSVHDAVRLNVMLDAKDARVVNSRFGDAGSDSVELLTGPGIIADNSFDIDERTPFVAGSDAASTVTITDNIVNISSDGSVSTVFRTWSGQYRHLIADNQVYLRGEAEMLVDARGYVNIVKGNLFSNYGSTSPKISVNGASVVQDNIIHRADVVVTDTAGGWKSTVKDNLLFYGSSVTDQSSVGAVISGNVETP